MRARLASCVFAGAVVVATGCTPAPVTTFERFYAAMASKDAPAFRALLCPAARALVAPLSDEALAVDLQVTRVVSRITVQREEKATKTVILDVEDATGDHESFTLREIDGAWCVELQQKSAPSQESP